MATDLAAGMLLTLAVASGVVLGWIARGMYEDHNDDDDPDNWL
jgi:hypothetical protein